MLAKVLWGELLKVSLEGHGAAGRIGTRRIWGCEVDWAVSRSCPVADFHSCGVER